MLSASSIIVSMSVCLNHFIHYLFDRRLGIAVVASGAGDLGSWQSVRRNVADDYRRACGAEPGRVLAVAVMTDTDNTGTKALGHYADIRFECAGG